MVEEEKEDLDFFKEFSDKIQAYLEGRIKSSSFRWILNFRDGYLILKTDRSPTVITWTFFEELRKVHPIFCLKIQDNHCIVCLRKDGIKSNYPELLPTENDNIVWGKAKNPIEYDL